MKVNGTATLNATPEQVWAALNDPAVLVRTIPGCEQLETVGTDRYRMRITAGVASIKGSYLGDVELADHVPHSAFTLKASGAGAPGTLSADVKVTLAEQPDGTTVLSYDADAVVGGTIGGVGQRVLGGVARRLAGEFFAAVDTQLTTGPLDTAGQDVAGQDVAAPDSAAPSAEVSLPAPATAGGPSVAAAPAASALQTVFTRPAPAAAAGGGVFDLSGSLPSVLVGAAIALLGVLLGWRLGRRG